MEVQPLASGRSGTVTGEVNFVSLVSKSNFKIFAPDLFAPWSIWKAEQSRHTDSSK